MDEYLTSVSEKALWAFKLVIKFIDNRALIFMLCSIVFTIGVSIFPNATFNVFDVEIPWRYFLGFFAVSTAVCGTYLTAKDTQSLHGAELKLEQQRAEMQAMVQGAEDAATEKVNESQKLVTAYQNDVRDVLKFALLNLATECNLAHDSICNNGVRLTLYCHESQKSVFVPVARISGNPEFAKEGRTEYPDDQGIIAIAWRDEFGLMDSNAVDDADWIAEQVEHHQLSEATATAISMKSRRIMTLRLTYQGVFIGLVVAEAERAELLNLGFFDEIKSASWFNPVSKLMLSVRESFVSHISNRD